MGKDGSGLGGSQGQRSLQAQGCGRYLPDSGGEPGGAQCHEIHKVFVFQCYDDNVYFFVIKITVQHVTEYLQLTIP